MNLYLITRNDDGDYDQYDSAVVAAPNEEVAKSFIEEELECWTNSIWTRKGGAFKEEHTKLDITIELIGPAVDGIEPGIVVASFNAG